MRGEKKHTSSPLSDTEQPISCFSHHRELRWGTDSMPTVPQGTWWPQTITRTMLSIMQHGTRINNRQDQEVSCPKTLEQHDSDMVYLNKTHTSTKQRIIPNAWWQNPVSETQAINRKLLQLFNNIHSSHQREHTSTHHQSLEGASYTKQKSRGMWAVQKKSVSL